MITIFRTSFAALLGLFLITGCVDQNETAEQQGSEPSANQTDPYTMESEDAATPQTGESETAGESGMSGTAGDTGTTGDTGTMGDTGTTGDTGTMGDTGTTGDTETTTTTTDSGTTTTTGDAGVSGVTIGEEQLNQLQNLGFEQKDQFIDGVRQARDSMQQATQTAATPLSSEGQQAMEQIDTNLERLNNANEQEFESIKSETMASLKTLRTEIQAH